MSEPDRKELQAEYILLQGHYEQYDQRALTLKGFATPLLGAGLATGFQQASPRILGVTVLAAAALWLLEVTWKVFQYCHVPRMEVLEAWFRGEGSQAPAPFQIYASWVRAFRHEWRPRPDRWLAMAPEPFIALPYALVLLAGAAGALAMVAGILPG